jgi:alkanesulfonate monooxygenase SsuD/methylene tetrahydromethanopterin reductase-like flavin-dependent oxidoreductase (luciferase family)
MAGVLIGRDEAEFAERVRALEATLDAPDDRDSWLQERLERWVTGTPDQARETVRRYAEAGVERIMLQDFLPWDLDMIDVIGEALIGKV